jgi:hypothetical protein
MEEDNNYFGSNDKKQQKRDKIAISNYRKNMDRIEEYLIHFPSSSKEAQ